MKKRVSEKIWIPFWVDKWLFGSMRIECTVEERGIWWDLLAMAAKDNGWIRANEDIAYPMEQLAGYLRIPKDKLIKAINKFVRLKKLTRYPNKTLYVTEWEKYQFSDRHKRRVMSEKPDMEAEKPDAIEKNNKTDHKKEKNKNNWQDLPPTKRIKFDFDKGEWRGILTKDIKRWQKTYPAVDIVLELRALGEWLYSNPKKAKSNYARFIANNLSRKQDKGGSFGSTPAGTQTKKQQEIDRWAQKPEEGE